MIIPWNTTTSMCISALGLQLHIIIKYYCLLQNEAQLFNTTCNEWLQPRYGTCCGNKIYVKSAHLFSRKAIYCPASFHLTDVTNVRRMVCFRLALMRSYGQWTCHTPSYRRALDSSFHFALPQTFTNFKVIHMHASTLTAPLSITVQLATRFHFSERRRHGTAAE